MKCCVGIGLLFLASGLLMESGAASAGSLEAIGRDGVFVAYANGVVADTRTGLEWLAGPDVDTSYHRAVEWVCRLTVAGGGWRMPTAKDLRTLYPNVAKAGGFQSQGAEGDAVVLYCNPLATRDLESSRFPERVKT